MYVNIGVPFTEAEVGRPSASQAKVCVGLTAAFEVTFPAASYAYPEVVIRLVEASNVFWGHGPTVYPSSTQVMLP